LDEWDVIGGVLVGDSHRWLVALRRVLTRHYGINGVCRVCEEGSPCSDETDAIDALLGVPDE
jgi:hypothetical protein